MHFTGVTLLITHYNRSSSLERLLQSFAALNCSFDEIIVSDDGSIWTHLEHINIIKEKYSFRLLTTSQNKGLGNNINKGQDAVITPYTLYIQEDFVPKPLFAQKLINAVQYMNKRPDYDMVRFYAYFKYPFLKPVGNGFSEMKFSILPWYWGYRKFYYYSDHPHLRRTNFFDKFGRYFEGLKVERTEYKMMFSFIQNKGKSLFYDDFQALFEQRNSVEEPSTVSRNAWRESENILVSSTRHLYRYIRFHFDFFLTPSTCKTSPEHIISYTPAFEKLDKSNLTRAELVECLDNLLQEQTADGSAA